MKKQHQSGFTLVEILLSIIAIGMIVFVGYYVYHTQTSNTQSINGTEDSSSSTKTNTNTAKKTAADPTAKWTAFTTPNGGYSFRYPTTWTKNVCDGDFVLLGPTEGTAGHCQSDGTAQMMLSAVKGDVQAKSMLDSTNYPDVVSTPITINGVTGVKETGTLNAGTEQLIGPANGSKVINYVFFANDTTYIAMYTQTPDFTDVSADFNLLVKNTLKFGN